MRATTYQKAQGVILLEEDKIIELVENLYEVQGRTGIYFVYYGTQRACTCEGFKWRGLCSHIKAVGLFRGNIQ